MLAALTPCTHGAIGADVARPVVLEAPSNLGLRPPAPGREPGAAKLADAMRKRGLVDRLQAEDAGRVPAPSYRPDPDFGTGFRNGRGLRGLGRYGLIFVDGHDDFSPARRLEEFKGRLAAAGMDLAVATGHAAGALDDLRGVRPYVRAWCRARRNAVRPSREDTSHGQATEIDRRVPRERER